MKIQIVGRIICLRHKGKSLLGIVIKLFVFKSVLTTPSNVLPLQKAAAIQMLTTQWRVYKIKSALPFKIFSNLTFFFLRGDESDYSEDDLNMNRSDESGSSASRVEPEPVMTIYQEDSLVEQFGSSTDQTEEFSDENKSIVWFLVKQVSILFIGFLFL